MELKSIKLTNFRNYEKREFNFGQVMVIKGNNGVGKSNILEAIYLLATGKSFRADSDSEMIRYGEKLSLVVGQMSGGDELRVILTDGSVEYGRKKFEINGVGKRGIDFVGRLPAVLFGPQDLDLITGSPSVRRRYLDFVIGQKDREYRRNLLSYEKGLRQRNRLLDLIRDGLAGRHQLYFWDKLVIKNGNYLTEAREKYLQGLGDKEHTASYDKSEISEFRLKQYEMEEVAAGSTLVGPHRDDFWVNYNDNDLSKYGSRGEQRMAVLWLKRGEIDFLTTENRLPLLLLDDIFSELDAKHREEVEKMVEELVNKGGQVIMTTAEPITNFGNKDGDIIRL